MAHLMGQLLMKKERLAPLEFRGRRKPLDLLRSLHPPPLRCLPRLMRLIVRNPHDSPTRALTPIDDQPNWWCVDGHYQVYSDVKFFNDKGFITRTLTFERWVLTGGLLTMPEIHNLFT